MFIWKDEYSVGIEEMDEQHKSLFKLLDDLSGSIESGDLKNLGYVLTMLEVYVVFHFTSEEYLLSKYGYPGLNKQEKEHGDFKAKVARFKAQSADDKIRLAGEVKDFLYDWLVNHILVLDKKYGPYLKEKMKGE